MIVDGPGTDARPGLLLPDAAAWRDWLDRHGAASDGVWLVLTKKGGTTTALAYPDAVDEALCQGWIDGQGYRRDEATSFVRFTPRRPRSRWSAINVGRVERLIVEGRMRPAGLAQVEAARADGRWDLAYGSTATIEVPADLLAALAAEPAAQAWWEVLTATNRFAICYRLGEARRPQTRERRLRALVADLADGRPPYPQKARPTGESP